MCTVSFIPTEQGCLLTSNRDEKIARQQAIPPQVYPSTGGKLLYPKDPDAGGTWVVMNDTGTAIVLLNGGFVPHQPNPPYKKSRGLMPIALIEKPNPVDEFAIHDLNNIEPFTLIIWYQQHLFEARWDGEKQHLKELDIQTPHIWSSVTLYTPDTIQKRENWFKKWLGEHPSPTQDAIINFHLFGGEGDQYNDIRMNRNGQMLTVSVTGMRLTEKIGTMVYHDLQLNQVTQTEISFADKHSVV